MAKPSRVCGAKLLTFRHVNFLCVGSRNYANCIGAEMSVAKVEQRALSLLNTFENAGKSVSRVTIEGRKIELVLSKAQDVDEFEGIDMRHGKT